MRGLTESLAQSTGANEELNHRIQVQNDKIDQMQKDFAYRLCTLSAQQMGAADSMNCAAAGTASASAVPPPPGAMQPGASLPPIGAAPGAGGFAPPADSAPIILNRPPGVLGTLPMGSGPMGSGPMGAGAPAAAPAVNSAQYDQAMNLMSRAQYDEAQAAFRAYADANPDDADLSPQAVYWVGNISYRAPGLCAGGARLRRSDQEISQVTARVRRYAQARPVLHGDGPEIGRLHHAWPHQDRNTRTPTRKPSPRPPASAKPPAANKLRPGGEAEGQSKFAQRFAAG